MEVDGYKPTELGLLPEDWLLPTLGELVWQNRAIRYGIVQPGKAEMNGALMLRSQDYSKGWSGPESMHRLSPFLQDQYRNARVRANDLVITVVGAGIAQVVQIPHWLDGAFLSRSTARVAVNEGLASSGYVYAFLQSEKGRRQVLELQKEGAQPVVSCRDVSRIHVPFPPLPEQRAIAEALSDVDELITSLDRLIAKKRDVKQGAMQQLLTGKTRLPGSTGSGRLKHTEVGDIPEEWTLRPLLTTVSVANGQVDPSAAPYKSMILVAPDHVERDSGRLLKTQTAEDQNAISGKYLFAPGDIIYSKIRPYLHKAILATFLGLCSADMYPLRPASDVAPGFMLATILGFRFSLYADSVSVRSGMPKINRAELASFVVALPPLKEQTAIAEVLSDMDGEIAALEARRDKTKLLKQGMMQELLTGKTRLV